jgi:hypothetical protein
MRSKVIMVVFWVVTLVDLYADTHLEVYMVSQPRQNLIVARKGAITEG